MIHTDAEQLRQALGKYQLDLPADQILLLAQYAQLLWQWNEKLNLTRHTDWDKFVTRDLVDSLQLSRLLAAGEEVLDVGSGGGVPGIVLAVIRPDLQLALSESVAKKAQAIDAMVCALHLSVPIFAARAEDLLDDFRYDTLIARAVGPLWKMLKWFQPHWSSIGRLLVVKGPRWTEERSEARHRGMMQGLAMRRVATYPTPGTDWESVILQIAPKQEMPAG